MALHTSPCVEFLLDHCPNVQGLMLRPDTDPAWHVFPPHVHVNPSVPFAARLPPFRPSQLKYLALEEQVNEPVVEGEAHIH
jgi:hypothetical protein